MHNNLRIAPFEALLPFRFTTSSTVIIRNKSLDHCITLLEGTEKPILTLNSHMPLSNKELAAIVRNASNNVDTQLNTIHANFHSHRRQHWTNCRYNYCKSHVSSHQTRGWYIGLKDTTCSVCRYKGHAYLFCAWIGPVAQKEMKFQANEQDS